MSDILVLGGGFAGVWAAAGAVRARRAAGVPAADLRVTLVSAGDDIVIRPRMYQSDPDRMRVPLDRILGPIGVRRVAATATGIDTDARRVTVVGRDGRTAELTYDRLVLATGSQLVRPDLPGAEHLFDVDTMPGAARLHSHLHRLPADAVGDGRFTAVVVGAGFAGLEVATELVGRLRDIATPVGAAEQVRVVLVERECVVGPELGAGPRPLILEALARLGVEQRLGVTPESATPTGVRLSDGSEIAASTVVWTAGMTASPLTADIPAERDRLGRLHVDEYLRVVGAPDVYAAGDTSAALADETHPVMQSSQHAQPLGKYAGHNVAADLLGRPQVPFEPEPYVTCLDLGAAGAVLTTGWERTVRKTGQDAKDLKHLISAVAIYPPVDDAEAILARADYRSTTWRASADATTTAV
ncbi:NAD(P)/FAD-dependent oxidoreductase [Pseudonocardia xinjiangensis]|uniref:NAD(P)/FAD-dependent oxidoreductase n=1 Tax=Pseudonocardia xinjiangensis TaxID=75289 RepID=UPI003D8CD2C4